MSLFPKFIAGNATVAKVANPAKVEPESENFRNFRSFRNAPIPEHENPNRTQPPAPGETLPFGQRELDAIKAGFDCWVWSGVLSEWLFWVRDDERRAKALAKGIDHWRIWTLDELAAAQGMTPDDVRNVHEIKRRFDGFVQPGDKPQRWRDALEPLQPVVAGDKEEAFEERAAILEYDAGFSRADAERMAAENRATMPDTAGPPPDDDGFMDSLVADSEQAFSHRAGRQPRDKSRPDLPAAKETGVAA